MKCFLTFCCFILGAFTAFAAHIPVNHNVQKQQIIQGKNDDPEVHYPTVEEIQKMARTHKGDLNSLANKILDATKPDQYPYDRAIKDVMAIWYDGNTSVIASLDRANNLRVEVYGPRAGIYLPNYKQIGVYRGNNYTNNLRLPEGSQGLSASEVIEVVSKHIPVDARLVLIASRDKFTPYNFDKVSKKVNEARQSLEKTSNNVSSRIAKEMPAELSTKNLNNSLPNNLDKISDKVLKIDDEKNLWALASYLIDGYGRVSFNRPIHSIWYKDGSLIVVTTPYLTYCDIDFYGAKRGTIEKDIPTVYPSESERILKMAEPMIPKGSILLAIYY